MSQSEELKIEKQNLRTRYLSMRKALSLESVEKKSFHICGYLEKELTKVKTVLFYMPVNHEVDLLPLSLRLFQKGYNILFPRVIDKENMEVAVLHDPEFDFVKGAYNIPEPKTEAWTGDIDIILVPGVVFDEKGYRVGYGKGYYDRHLSRYPDARRIGIAFRFQIIPRLPFTDHDIRMNALVTEDGLTKFK